MHKEPAHTVRLHIPGLADEFGLGQLVVPGPERRAAEITGGIPEFFMQLIHNKFSFYKIFYIIIEQE